MENFVSFVKKFLYKFYESCEVLVIILPSSLTAPTVEIGNQDYTALRRSAYRAIVIDSTKKRGNCYVEERQMIFLPIY